MSVYQQAPAFYQPTFPPSQIHLAAHTANATALTKRLFEDRISQEDYDDQILATSIMSITRVASIPIVMTMDDTLATILAHAARGLEMSYENTERAKLYLLCPKGILESLDISAFMSDDLALLDRDGLNKLLKFMKGSDSSHDELVIACEDDLEAPEMFKKLLSRVGDREDETVAMRNWRPTASSGGRRARELWSEVGSSAQKLVQAHHRNVQAHHRDAALRRTREFHKANEQHHMERGAPGAKGKEGRETG